MDKATLEKPERPGKPSLFSCPECNGVLWEIEDGDMVRYRCRVGHAYSPDTMLSAQSETLEAALWSALKTLEESERLSTRLAQQERARGHMSMVERFEKKAKEARDRANSIREVLTREETLVPVKGV